MLFDVRRAKEFISARYHRTFALSAAASTRVSAFPPLAGSGRPPRISSTLTASSLLQGSPGTNRETSSVGGTVVLLEARARLLVSKMDTASTPVPS
jgi:hypothetical protein